MALDMSSSLAIMLLTPANKKVLLAILGSSLAIMLLTPNLSLAFIDNDLPIEKTNIYDDTLPIDLSSYRFRESMLIDIRDIEYNSNIARVIIIDNNLEESLGDISYQLKFKDNSFALASIPKDNIPLLKARGFNVIRDQPLDFLMPDISRFQEISKTDIAIAKGFSANNTKIAIVDTGTDFSNLDIRDAVARDDENKPIMLDADAQGIVLTRTKFIAKFDNGRIVNNTDITYDEYTSDVYVNKEGVFLRAVRENKTLFQIYNPLYPFIAPLIFNATANGDWKIGKSDEDYIRSVSGVYRMGFMVEAQFHLGRFGLIIVPVLVVDSKEAGVYDTVIPDMSDAWVDFAIFELRNNDPALKFDFDFTDEVSRAIGDGNEMLLYDADNDTRADLTAGMLGARVVDLWGAINKAGRFDLSTGLANATVLEPMDINGTYFGIMYDFFGHGTATASVIASKGTDSYDIYNNGTEYKIEGIAPDAKIIPVKALWFGDTPYSWLWAAGFELVNGTWEYTGKHKADVISNSWSIPVFTLLSYAPGYDPVSILADILSTPRSLSHEYTGTLIVTSAGNSGYGHGSISSPAASPLTLTVGASTNNIFVGYGFTKDQPRFGNSTKYYNDIAEFSSRGPLANGYTKPEILATGAYAFVPMLVNVKYLDSEPVSIFGGTSMAAPLVAGASAIIIQALKEKGIEPDPQLVKNILLSSAKDIKNEPFAQGSGVLDLENALKYIEREEGSFLVYTNDTAKEILDIIDYKDYPLEANLTYLDSLNWYAGFINRNSSKEAVFKIHNPSNSILYAKIKPTTLELIKQLDINGTTEVRKFDPVLNDTGGFAPNYIRLNKTDIPKNTELIAIKLRFPFETFMNMSEVYAHNLRISSLYLYEWSDVNNDNEIWYNETKLVNRGGAYGTLQDLSVYDPLNRIKDEILIGVYPVPNIISFWTGVRDINATSMNYTLTIDFYKKSKGDLISTPDTLLVKPNGTGSFTARIDIPSDAPFGIYQGYITVKSSKQETNIPVSFAVPVDVKEKDVPIVITNNVSKTVFYEPSSLIGSFDMSSRFNSGEWKFYHLNITDPSINVISTKIVWENDLTSIAAFAIDPKGRIIAKSVPAGVFETFASWGSNDWLGSGALGSGAFYPASNFGNNTTVFYIPVNSTGMYTLMLHNTLFHAKNLTEPFRIELKASTILPDTNTPTISFAIPKYVKGLITLPVEIDDPNIYDVRYSIDGFEDKVRDGEIVLDTRALEDGLHSIQIEAKDSVGNRVTKGFTFIVDNRDPEIMLKLEDLISNVTDVRMDIVEPNLANLTVSLPDGNIINQREFSFDTSSLNDGVYEIIINATDLAGNISILKKEIEIDNTPPIIDARTSATTNIEGAVDILYNVTDNNLAFMQLVVDDAIIDLDGSGEHTLDTSSLSDGEHRIEIIAKDLAGNSASKIMRIYTINQEVLANNSRNNGILIGIGIGAGVIASILLPLYLRKH